MGKLSALVVGAALLLGGCGEPYEAGPPEFTIRSDRDFIVEVCSAAAERINADSPDGRRVTVVLELGDPGLLNAFPYDGSGYDQTLAVQGARSGGVGGRELLVGELATVDTVESALRRFTDCPLEWASCGTPD